MPTSKPSFPTLPSVPWRGLLRWFLLGAALALYGLHYVHLSADFPNYSPWMDWSKYTDEGWYGDAAIRHFLLGHWYVAGDFNAAVALPVWPILEGILFRFTGVSLNAARALSVSVFGGILISSFLLMQRWSRGQRGALAPAAGVLLLAASPFCFVFTRLAILEPILVLWTLLALLAAGATGRVEVLDWQAQLRADWKQILALACLLPVIVLTKTTGMFLLPGVLYLLFASTGYRVQRTLQIAVPAGLAAAMLWGGYFLLLIHRGYLLDYRYLFSANAYTKITLATAVEVLVSTFKDGAWMGSTVYAAAVMCLLLAAVFWRRLRDSPLIVALILWAVGYAAFLAYHDNLQPRYYLVIAVPLTLLVPVFLEQMVLPMMRRPAARQAMMVAAGLLIAAIAIPDAHTMIHYARHPEYTLLHAARGVEEYIAADQRRDPKHNPLVLSISGSDLSLMTGLRSICDDFGTLELEDRVKVYRPGWYAAWNEIDDDKMDALAPLYRLERVAEFPAMDDPDRNLLILYRLEDADTTTAKRGRRKPVPKRLKTKVGQQPSTSQLEH